MADLKITEFTEDTVIASTDIIPMIDDPGGTPANQKMTFATLDTFVNTARVLAAGTATAGTAPLTYTSGTLLTTPEVGATEFLTNIHYQTHAAGNRAVSAGIHFTSNVGDFTGSNVTTAQPIFQAANDTFTADANTTYIFDLFISVTNGTTTCTKALIFAGTATYAKIRYDAIGQNVAINTVGTTQSTAHVDRATSTIILATGTTSWWIKARGIIRISTAGTIIPQFEYGTNAPGTTVLIKSESYMTLIPVGSDTVGLVGAWA